MSCCNPRAAINALEHLWISDDVLAGAFHRFARVSHTARRHGSSVPGPMEARRRLAKRRLGMAAVASGSAPPSLDIGALFGLGSATPPPNFEKGWRWEAPYPVPLDGSAAKKGLYNPTWGGIDSDGSIWAPEHQTEKESAALEDFLSLPTDAVEESRREFTSMLENIERKTQLSQEDLRPVLQFLESQSNEQDAQLTLHFVQWLGSRSVTVEGFWTHLSESICNRVFASSITQDELLSILVYILDHRADYNDILPTMAQIPPVADTQKVYPKFLEHILNTTPDRATRIEKIKSWIGCLRPCEMEKSGLYRRGTFPRLTTYELLAKHFDPSDFPAHFATMRRYRFAKILMFCWVRRYASETPASPHVDNINWLSLRRGFKARKHELDCSPNDLLRYLSHNKVPYARLATEIFAVFLNSGRKDVAKLLLNDLTQYGRKGVFTHVALRLAKHFYGLGHHAFVLEVMNTVPHVTRRLAKYFYGLGDYAFVLEVMNAVPTIPLRTFSDLPQNLIRQGSLHPAKLFELFIRRIPPSQRGHGLLWLKQEDIDLIHESACAWAESPHINARAAFRRVWECYRFLHSRRATLTPLLSRAMVKAGISRAVKENNRLSAAQVRYIVSIVRRIEGRDIADQVDRLVFDYWKRVQRETGGYVPGERQDQSGFWKGNRWLWSKVGKLEFDPARAKKKRVDSNVETESRGDLSKAGEADAGNTGTKLDESCAELVGTLGSESRLEGQFLLNAPSVAPAENIVSSVSTGDKFTSQQAETSHQPGPGSKDVFSTGSTSTNPVQPSLAPVDEPVEKYSPSRVLLDSEHDGSPSIGEEQHRLDSADRNEQFKQAYSPMATEESRGCGVPNEAKNVAGPKMNESTLGSPEPDLPQDHRIIGEPDLHGHHTNESARSEGSVPHKVDQYYWLKIRLTRRQKRSYLLQKRPDFVMELHRKLAVPGQKHILKPCTTHWLDIPSIQQSRSSASSNPSSGATKEGGHGR